jgi:hypothetical protein
LFYYVPGQKLGVGATGHAKMAGRRSNPKFEDYTKNSEINFKTTVELKILMDLLGALKNVISNSARSAEFPVY